MRKIALIFVLAVLLPSLVLAWLAVRSLHNQEFILERQQTLLCQSLTDRLAQEAAEVLAEHQREFARQVDQLLADRTPEQVASTFDDDIRAHWPLAEVGFVVSLQGRMLAPPLTSRPEARQFRLENDKFLCNAEAVEVFWNNPKGGQGGFPQQNSALQGSLPGQQQALVNPSQLAQVRQSGETQLDTTGQQQALQALEGNAYKFQQLNRRVLPQNYDNTFTANNALSTPPESKVAFAEAEFRQIIGDATDGTMARFLQNRLNVMTWYRPPREPHIVFGSRLNLARLTEELGQLVAATDRAMPEGVCLAILDDNSRPVARMPSQFNTSWRRPFVAAEIGDALPHWEAAAYLMNPGALTQAAARLRLSLSLLTAGLIIAIGAGGMLIAQDLRRELTLARQKTDFVSNVSHELKTPLTSIRMFSELLADGRVTDEEKRRSYLAIITAETARLTRLINNVLDFSRMERGEKKYDFQPCDLAELAREAARNFRPQLESSGFRFTCELPPEPLLVHGDRDALSQVLLNLLSNAEKYSCNGAREITLQLRPEERPIPHVELRVLDRGGGVPRGCEEKIFEKFYRAHDSLASGIQGSGLGLTLARQIARAHGGDVSHEPREGGGSVFVLRLPLARSS
jgi:signal transduction histidine kinase